MQAKNDSLKVTGGGGGTEALLGPLEVAVLEVIGRDSAAVKGLSVKESIVGSLESTKSTSSSCATSIAGQFQGGDRASPHLGTQEGPLQAARCTSLLEQHSSLDTSHLDDFPESGESPRIPTPKSTNQKKRARLSGSMAGNAESVEEFKKQKLQLQVQHLKLSNYKLQLEAYKLESELVLLHKSAADAGLPALLPPAGTVEQLDSSLPEVELNLFQ